MKTKLLPIILACGLLPAAADTTFDNTAKFAWGANTGWVSFRHDQPASPAGVVFGAAFLSGYAYSANLGWINFGSGAPANGYAYANTGSDHGVNHDGAGNLSGFAWSANTGWINFGWATPTDSNRPRANLVTGAFSGYAWSANTGWINLGTGLLTTQAMRLSDSDGDGIEDTFEWRHFGNLTTANATSNSDEDDASDLQESRDDTDPRDHNSFLRVVWFDSADGLTAARIEFTSTSTRLYRIEYREDLTQPGPWTNSALGVFAPDVGATTTRDIAFPAGTRRFFRVIAVVPLQP